MIKLELPKLPSNRIVEGKKTMTKENDIYNPNKKTSKILCREVCYTW